MLRVALIGSSLLALASYGTAQIKPHEKTLPQAFAGSWTGGSNAFPWGRSRGFFQQWYRGDNLRTGPIVHLGVREDERASSAAMTHKLEIVMSNTSAGFQLSKTFASNLGTLTSTFFAMKNLSFPPLSTPSDPNASSVWIPGDKPFVYVGPNFIVQFDIQTATTWSSNSRRTDGLFQTSTLPQHGRSGNACGGGSLAASYSAGSVVLSASGLGASPVAIFLVGLSSQWFGAIRLPLDLTAAGWTGCSLDVQPLFVFGSAASSGTATLALPIGVPANDTWPIHSQVIHADASKPSGWATTNATWTLLGNTQQSNYIYNWTQDGPTAQYGPYAVNSNIVVFIRP